MPMRLRPSRVAGRQALEEPVERGRVVRVEGPGLPRADLGRGVLQAVGIAAGEDESAPSARARRAAPSPMPALPPITATACPARSGSRWLETQVAAQVMVPPVGGPGGGSPDRRRCLPALKPTHRYQGQG